MWSRSSPLVGSSKRISPLSERSAHATARRCFCPPDRAMGCTSRAPEKVERGKRRLCPLLGFPLLPAAQREHALVPDAVAEELVVDVLHHERDEAPPGAARDLLPSDEGRGPRPCARGRQSPGAACSSPCRSRPGRLARRRQEPSRLAGRTPPRPPEPRCSRPARGQPSVRLSIAARGTRTSRASPAPTARSPIPSRSSEESPRSSSGENSRDYAAFLDENGAVDEVRGEIEPVLGDDDGPALRDDGAHLVMQPLHGGRVEVRGGLVEHVHVGPRHVDGGGRRDSGALRRSSR